MSVYDVNGTELSAVYNINGSSLNDAYDISGDIAFNSWYSEITVVKQRYISANYYFIHIPQTRSNGQKQYPFVYCPDGTSSATETALDVARSTGLFAVINAGVFNTTSRAIDGVTIQNSSVILNTPSAVHPTNPQAARLLTINSSGLLSYAEYDSDGYSLVSSGIVSCISGFMPIVVNGIVKTDWINLWSTGWSEQDAQRQVIGQFSNGDYAIVTSEGRNFDDSSGLTVYEIADLCISLGLEYAYLLDCGGSVETVIDGEQLNVIYEGSTGRKVPSFIFFNGTDEFGMG